MTSIRSRGRCDQQLLDDPARGAQVGDRLEEWDAEHLQALSEGEPLGGEDILRRRRHRDDQTVERARPVPALDAGARAQRLEQALVRLPDRARVDAQVELRQVEAEQRDPRAEIREAAVRDARAARARAGSGRSGRARPAGRRSTRSRRRRAGPRASSARRRYGSSSFWPDGTPISFSSRARVVLDDRRGHPPAPRERPYLVPVEPRGQRPRLLERRLDRLRARVRVPVQVAADPGAEAERDRCVRQRAAGTPATRPARACQRLRSKNQSPCRISS